MDAQKAGTGYLAIPDATSGRGVLVLHSWWGRAPYFRERDARIAGGGFRALAPDLCGGAKYAPGEEAQAHLASAEANQPAHVVRPSRPPLRGLPVTYEQPAGV